MLGAIGPRARFAGGPDQEGVGFIPNLTPDHLGHWSAEDIVAMLKTGYTPDLRFVGSSMADVVTNTATLPESDRAGDRGLHQVASRHGPTPPPS